MNAALETSDELLEQLHAASARFPGNPDALRVVLLGALLDIEALRELADEDARKVTNA
jgi:hypothetical protein